MKLCRTCGVEKDYSQFFKRTAATKTGVGAKCRSCCKESQKKYYEKNKETLKEKVKVYQEKNIEAIQKRRKRYYEENKETLLKKNKDWREKNGKEEYLRRKPYFRMKAAERRSCKNNATPKWLSEDQKQEIQGFYWLASDLKLVSGEEYHVDHIIPIKGKNVCGLHVPWNLQVLPSDINQRKGNHVPSGFCE